MNYRKILCHAALAVFTFSSALCMKNVYASDTQAGSQSAPKTSAASANMIPVLNYVPADADTVAFFNIKNFMNAESQNGNVLKNGISN